MRYRPHLPSPPPPCPPEEAEAATGMFYRLVDNDPVAERDFRSPREEKPKRKFPPHVSECEACAVSMFADLHDVKTLRANVKPLEQKKVAVGEFSSNAGVIKHTPCAAGDSHHDYWAEISASPWANFRVVG